MTDAELLHELINKTNYTYNGQPLNPIFQKSLEIMEAAEEVDKAYLEKCEEVESLKRMVEKLEKDNEAVNDI